MRYVVTGATGFVGKRLVSELLCRGHEVTVLGRSADKTRALFGNAVRFFRWDAETAPPAEAVENAEVVVHLAGEGIADRRWDDARKDRIRLSRVGGTRVLVNALSALGGKAPVLVAASAIGFYGDRGDERLVETSSPGEGFLAALCVDWEREIFRYTTGRAVALRIGVVLGREGGALPKMIPPFHFGLGGRLGSGRQWMSWIHQDDLVALILEAAENEGYAGPYNAVAPEPVTNAEFTRTLGRVLRRPAVLPAPAPVLRAALGELAGFVLASTRVVPERAVQAGFRFRFPALAEALQDTAGRRQSVLETFQLLPKPVAQIFPFFADEKNLETLTPPWLHFRVLRKSTERLGEGSLIDYRLRVRGVPLRWRSKILDWKPGSRFVDQQVIGPYRLWHHTHQFVEVPGGTLMRDLVLYEVPPAPLLGPLVRRFVDQDVRRIFAFRYERIRELFGG